MMAMLCRVRQRNGGRMWISLLCWLLGHRNVILYELDDAVLVGCSRCGAAVWRA